jgi:hypothetical protein
MMASKDDGTPVVDSESAANKLESLFSLPFVWFK